ncbi:MAG: putative Ig domain-containing protein, partial [Roseomonas sp.]|nr:putative Ig domain-containing protein [Roseomonas sp.]
MLQTRHRSIIRCASVLALACALAQMPHLASAQQLQPLYRFQVQTVPPPSNNNPGGQTGGPQTPPGATLSVSVTPPTQTLFVGQPYVAQAFVNGQSGPVSYALQPVQGDTAALGLTFNSTTGTLSGTLSSAGYVTFQVRATNPATSAWGNSPTVSVQAVVPTVNYGQSGARVLQAGAAFTSSTPTTDLPGGVFGAGNFFPSWASVNPQTGVITGTPSIASAGYSYALNVNVQNGAIIGSGSYVVTVQPFVGAITYPGQTPNYVAGEPFTSPVPTSPLSSGTYSTGGTGFPAWATVNPSTGVISGTIPANAGNQVVQFGVNALQDKATASGTWTIGVQAPTVSVANAPPRVVAGGIVSFFATTNIPGPVTWSMTNAPAWLSINPTTGQISGTANSGQLVDGAIVRASKGTVTTTATLNIGVTSPIALNYGNQNPPVDTNRLFTLTPSVSGGGAGGNAFSISAGSLPPGLSLNASTGVISGVATSTGNFPVTIRVTDSETVATFPMTMRVQTVVASNQCYGPGEHSFTVPAYTILRFDMTAAGGQGGGVTNEAGNFSNNADGGSVSMTLRGRTVFVPGGRGGGATSLTQIGTTPQLPTPALTGSAPLAGERTFEAGTWAPNGFRTSGTIPANPGRGASTILTASVQPVMPAFGSG